MSILGEEQDTEVFLRKPKKEEFRAGMTRCSFFREGSLIRDEEADDAELEEIDEGRPCSGWVESELCGDSLASLCRR